MQQLVGQSCVLCGRRITSELDARFCPVCKKPIHDGCISGELSSSSDVCPRCGSPRVQPTLSTLSTIPTQSESVPGEIPKHVPSVLLGAVAILFAFLISLFVIVQSIQEGDIPLSALRIALLFLSFVVTPLLASRKGYTWFLWILGGSILGLLVLAFLPYANSSKFSLEQQKITKRTGDNIGTLLSLICACIFFAAALMGLLAGVTERH
jgi:hypothetical protein